MTPALPVPQPCNRVHRDSHHVPCRHEFSLHFVAWRGYSLRSYWRDPEFRAYTWILLAATALGTAFLTATGYYKGVGESLRQAAFHVVSFMTTTGFTATGFDQWPGALPLTLILLGFIGAAPARPVVA